jgi:hypothetical protein
MRQGLIQLLCVLAIGIGAGLYAFADHLVPEFDPQNPAIAAIGMHDRADYRISAVAAGLGVACMTCGALGLVIPWINAAIERRHDTRFDTSERVV